MMRPALYINIFFLLVLPLAGCARPMLPAGAPMPPVTARAAENVSDDVSHDVSASLETKSGDPCAGTSGNSCGGSDSAGDEPVAGLQVPSASFSAGTPTGPAGYGTPAEGDFSFHGETITEDTEWRGRVAINGSLTIAPQATVTIDPGTVVEFRRSSREAPLPVFLVHGRLVARGTEDQPVSFKAAPGEDSAQKWHGIMFLASDKKNIMEHCRLEGAETGIDAEYSDVTVKNSLFSGCRTALRAEDSLLYIRESKAVKCGMGITLYDSEAELVSVSLVSNRTAVFSRKSSVYLSGSTLSDNEQRAFSAEDSKVKIIKNTFERNGSGISLFSCEGGVSGNGIVENRDYGISLNGSLVKVNANDISRNNGIGLRVGDGKGIAWGNIISSNGRYDLYNAGSEDFLAVGNWWREGHSPDSPGSIYDKSVNDKSGRVIYFPVLRERPDTAP